MSETSRETDFESGRRAAFLEMLYVALRGLGVDDPAAQGAVWVKERAELLQVLRRGCDEHGDNDWPDDLHLGDALDKHLLDYLQ